MTIFFSELFGYNLLSTRFLIGIYYGILTTFPLAPSQLLSIRVLLLEEENQQSKMVDAGAAKGIFIAGISGFLIAQFLMFLSIYYTSLYEVWFKPHLFNFLLPFFLIWNYLKIIEFDPVFHLILNYKYAFFDPRVRIAFLESFVLQIINPIVLPNPVFTRLLSIFLFQYSHIPIFCLGSIIGWISGQLLFFKLSWFLLSKLQSDSPSIYRIAKRIVHWLFPPIIIGIFLSYIGRVSMVPIGKKIHTIRYKTLHHTWPDTFYNRDKSSRLTHFMLSSNQSKLRNQTNVPFNVEKIPLHKKHFSQFFFQACFSNGQKRLLHNYPISLSIIQNDLKDLIEFNYIDDSMQKTWNENKKNRLFHFNKILDKKIYQLDQEKKNNVQKKISSINQKSIYIDHINQYFRKKNFHLNELSYTIRKYTYSLNLLNKRIRKSYDIRLDNSLRNQSKIVKNESFWLMNQKKDTIFSLLTNRSYLPRWQLNIQRLNRLKKIFYKIDISNNYFNLKKKIPIWKNQLKSSSFDYEFEFSKKNLTRRRRRISFVRSFIEETTVGRSQNLYSHFYRFLENKPRSSFFLRANQVIISNKDHRNSIEHMSQIESEKFDFSNSHSIRGPALIIQAIFRRYIRLPLLILGKSLIRFILFQPSEWEQDWLEWTREKYVYCSYNGNYFSDTELPLYWFGDGLQIKILSPVYITPWRLSPNNQNITLQENTLMTKSSYINIWGQETEIPFGPVIYTPFLKPILKSIILLIRNEIAKIIRIFYKIYFYIKKNYLIYINNLFFNKRMNSTLNVAKHHDDIVNTSYVKKSTFIEKSRDISLEDKEIIFEEKDFSLNKENLIFNHQRKKIYIFENKQKDLIKNQLFVKNILFPKNLILKKKKEFFKYKVLKIRIIFIKLIEQILYIKQKFLYMIKYVSFYIQNKQIKLIREIIKCKIYIINISERYLFNIDKYIINILNNNLLLDLNRSYLLDLKSRSNDYLLSHAYLLHKIWESQIFNRPSITQLVTEWKKEEPLQDHIKIKLNQYGLLEHKSTYITAESFEEWLKPLKRSLLSRNIWKHIHANSWRQEMDGLWIKNNRIDEKRLSHTKQILKQSNQYLSYHKPFFEKNKKMIQRWKIMLLIQNYMNPFQKKFLYDIGNNYQNSKSDVRELIKKQITSKNYLFKKKNLLELQKINNIHFNFPYLLAKSNVKSFILNKKANTFEKQPIFLKYNKIMNLNYDEYSNLTQRVVFKPIVQYRWKHEQDRSKVLNTIDIIRKAKSDFQNARQNAMLAKKYQLKSTTNFIEKAQIATFQWKTLNLSPFTCQSIKKKQSKILDDEMIMHNLIISWLQFKKKYLYLKQFKIFNITNNSSLVFNKNLTKQIFLLPEDLFLNQTLREYRILSSLKLKVNNLNKTNENILEKNTCLNQSFIKNKNLYSYEMIKRYLWPSYRLENLACFNRFLMNTANQSRFSNLRIRMYPHFVSNQNHFFLKKISK